MKVFVAAHSDNTVFHTKVCDVLKADKKYREVDKEIVPHLRECRVCQHGTHTSHIEDQSYQNAIKQASPDDIP